MHRMQILASFEPPKFRSEGRQAREGASRKGARPCPQRVLGVRNPHISLRHKLHGSIRAGVLGSSLGRGYELCGRTSRLRSSTKFAQNESPIHWAIETMVLWATPDFAASPVWVRSEYAGPNFGAVQL